MDIVVFDDELEFIEHMKNALAEICTKHNGAFGSPVFFNNMEEILLYAEAHRSKPIVFLLDIMTGNEQTGYKIAKRMKELNPDNLIIYITYFKEKILSNVYERIYSFLYIYKDSDNFNDELEQGLIHARDALTNQYFIIKSYTSILKIKYENIYYFEKSKENRFVSILHKDGIVRIWDSLVSLKEKLDHNFLYASRELIVNVKAVIKIDKKEKLLYFDNNIQCYYSKTRRKELLNAISNHII